VGVDHWHHCHATRNEPHEEEHGFGSTGAVIEGNLVDSKVEKKGSKSL
jgi:hypothetical protein